MRRLVSAALMTAMLATHPVAAWAQDVTKKVEELSAQAAAAYGEARYADSIELFKQAYALQPVPNLLFNIAKVYEKMEDWDRAEDYYREFIKSPDADARAREVALERIDAIKEIKRLAAEAAKEPVEEPVKQPVEQPPPTVAKKKANVAPWIVLGSGVVLAGTGAVFGVMASGTQSDFEAAPTPEEKQELRSTGKTQALVADVLYGAGAVAGLVGIVMLLTSGSSDQPAQARAIVPTGWVGPHGEANVGLHVRF